MQKTFLNTLIFSLGIFFAFSLFISPASAAVLLPGNISSCGELAAPGTYTLTGNINGGSNTCLFVSSSNVTIVGDGFTISGTGTVAIDARTRTGGVEGPLTEAASASTNLVINDLNITGYTTGINLSGNNNTTGSSLNGGNAGDAGDVAIFYSVVGSVIADGGDTTYVGYGGIGGNIAFTDTDLDISDSTISTIGGTGTSGRNTDGGLDLNYSGALTRTGIVLSSLSFFNDNTTEYGVYPGGSWPITPGSVSSCGTLYGPGTFTLTQSVTSSSTCFYIFSNNVTINGNGYSITGAATTDFAVVAGNFSSTTVASTTVSNYSNFIISSSSVTVSGNNLDLSNKYIAAGSLTLTYGTLNKTGATVSALTNLTVNGVSYGSYTAGALLEWLMRTTDVNRNWFSIASSADGTKLAAVVQGGQIYTSTDSGLSWTARESNRNWYSITSSADGTKLAAVEQYGQIYTSNDSGLTWTARDSSRTWFSITSSADGTKLAATVRNNKIYTSSDSGVTWIARDSNRDWLFIASSADGVKLVAGVENGRIYTSTDSGVTWTARDSNRPWRGISSSADGTKLAATKEDGQIYISNNSGVSWTAQGPSKRWWGITSSADGTKLFAGAQNGQIYTSTDSGLTWTASESNRNWISLATSADGTKVVAAAQSGKIFARTDNPRALSVDILSPQAGLIISWSPVISWGTATSCYYSYDNFVSTTTANCALAGSDIPNPGFGSKTLYARGIDANNVVVTKSIAFNYAVSNLSSCGTISSPGTYTLSQNITGVTGVCFVITSDNVTIDGGNYRVTATSSNNKFAITATSSVANGGSAYTNLTVKNIVFSGFSGGGINATGNIGTSYGGAGGHVSIASSSLGAIITSGNYAQFGGNDGGAAGNISVTGSSTVGALTAIGGSGASYWCGRGASAGNIVVSFSTVNGNVTTQGGGSGFICSQNSSKPGGTVDVINSRVNGAILSIGANEGNGNYTNWNPGPSSGVITVSDSIVTGTITGQAGNGLNPDRIDLSGSTGSTGGTPSLIQISSSTVSHIISQGGNGGGSTVEYNASAGGNGGPIVISNSIFGNISSLAGRGGSPYNGSQGKIGGRGGNSGDITINGSVVNLSGKTIYAFGGAAGGSGGTLGSVGSSSSTISISYTTSFTDPAFHSPFGQVFLSLPDGTSRYGANVASTTLISSLTGLLFNSPGNINNCGTISSPGTYTLTQNITGVTGVCFVITSDNVVIDGGGYSVTATSTNSNYAVTAGSSQNLTLQNIVFSGFKGGLVSSNSSVTYAGTNINLSNSTSTVASLTINYTGALTTLNTWFSNLTSLIINNTNFGSTIAGLFTWSAQNISSCTTLSSPGTYTLTQNITGVTGVCFVITSDNVVIDGGGYTITATGGNTNYAFDATMANANARKNIAIKNLTVVGFGGGIDARGANGISGNTLGRNGGNILLQNVVFPTNTVSVNTSGGNGFYESNTTALGGNGGNISIASSTSGTLILNGGNTNGDTNIGSDNGTNSGGSAGVVTNTNSSINQITAVAGAGYIPGCIDNSFDNYNANATYNDGSCSNFQIGTERHNPLGNTVTGPIDFYYYRNNGVVNGNATFYIYDLNYNNYDNVGGNYGTTTGFAIFEDDGYYEGFGNYGYVGNGALFSSGSINSAQGVVNGTTTFSGGRNYGIINGTTDFTQEGNYGAYNYGTVNGDATFYADSENYNGVYNYGTVTGVAYYYYGCVDSVAANYQPTALNDDGSCLYYGTSSDLPEGASYTGNVTFSNGTSNYGTVVGNAIFEEGSYNYGTVTGDAKFNEYISNGSGVYFVDGSNVYYGTGIVGGSVLDQNDDEIILFNFSNGTENNYTINSRVVFNDTSFNSGKVIGDATFNTTYYASTTAQNGIFSFEDNGWSGTVLGDVLGSDNNPITLFAFYNSTANNGTTTADAMFHDSSRNTGTVTGDATLYTDYYSGSLPTTATLTVSGSAEWRGTVTGDIFASDGTTEITSFNFSGASANYATINSSSPIIFSGTASNNGTIQGDATFSGTTFRVGTVNGTATFEGVAQTIQGANSVVNFFKNLLTQTNDAGRDTLFFSAGSTLNVSGLFTLLGTDADNLLTLRSTIPGSYATLNINGTSNFDFLRLKDIRNTAGTVDLSSKTAFNDGGNSGFTFTSNSTPGQRNGTTGNRTAPALPVSRGGAASGGSGGSAGSGAGGNPANTATRRGVGVKDFFNSGIGRLGFAATQAFAPLSSTFNSQNIGSTVLPSPFASFNIPGSIGLTTLPTNFFSSISKFLFAPVPRTITETLASAPRLQSLIASAGFNKEQDLAALGKNPLTLPNPSSEDMPEGLFIVRSGETTLTSYVTYENGLAQLVKALPNQSLTVSVIPLSSGPVTATYLSQTISFASQGAQVSATITTPSSGGRFVLKTASSPLPLLIEVQEPVKVEEKKPWGIFNFVWKVFNK